MTISGVSLADKIAEGKLTETDRKALAAQKEESLKKQNIWKKQQEAKKEFGRGFQIELEKEKRVKAGLPEYDITNTNNAPAKSGKKKAVRADDIIQKQKGSDALGELRKKSRAKALAEKAKHQAETQSATGKHIHKELKEAKKLDPASVKDINEKELMKKAGADFKPYDKNVVKNTDDVIKNTGKTVNDVTKKSEGAFSKLGKFFKGKGGKIAIVAGALAILGAGATWLYNKFAGKKDEVAEDSNNAAKPTTPASENKDKTDPTKPVTTPGKDDKTDPEKPVATTPGKDDKTDPTKPVAPTPGKDNKTDPTKPVDSTPGKDGKTDNTVPKDYVVKKGDCVWNIAKQHLKDLSNDPNYKPTDAEILKHTKELMELNKLEFEPDGYHVMIRPDDKLKLVA